MNILQEINKLLDILRKIDDGEKFELLLNSIKANETLLPLISWESVDSYKNDNNNRKKDLIRQLHSLRGKISNNLSIDEKIEAISPILDSQDNDDEKFKILSDYIVDIEEYETIIPYFQRGGLDKYNKYNNMDRYVELLSDYYNKFSLAQKMCDFELASKILQEYPFSEDERKKLDKLAENNEDLVTLLNPKLLSEKYSFLDKYLDFIINDDFTSKSILKLSDGELSLFKLLLDKAQNENAELLHTIRYISKGLKKCNDLTNSIVNAIYKNEEIDDGIINKLLWIYTSDRQDSHFKKDTINESIKDINDVSNLEGIIKQACDDVINLEKSKPNKNIEKIKEALIMVTYGISFGKASSLINAFDVTGIDINEDNKKTMLMYLAISQICNETNPDKLLLIYDEYVRDNPIRIDYLRDVVFQNELRTMFAREFNNAYAKVEDFNKIDEQEGISIYDAGTDFKICMTAVGAYNSDFKKQENYFDYWNNKKILSHINCCSLIANNNLATAKINNICFGFSSFNEDMFICAANRDVNSSDKSTLMYGMEYDSYKVRIPNRFVDSTRGEYNEIDYERRDLGNGKYYKKNPDFVVFFEEFDNLDDIDMDDPEVKEILLDEKRKWKESLKAANDFGIPIVKINRERCAKSESEKIDKCFKEYLQTHDVSLLSNIITNFENNRTGTRGHNYLTNKYFSDEKIENMMNQIISSVNELEDTKLRESNFKEIIKVLNKEMKSLKESDAKKALKGVLGFDIDQYLEKITNLIDIDFDEVVL